MSFVIADSFVSLTDALVRITLKYWWWLLWWMWFADYSAPCFERWWMLLSSQSHSKTLFWAKGKHPWAMKQKLLYIHRLNPHSTAIKNRTKLTLSKNAGYIALQQVIESVSNLLWAQHNKCSVIIWRTPDSCVLPKLGGTGIMCNAFHCFFSRDVASPNATCFPQRDTCHSGESSAGSA